jgi:hypothetical protein
MFRLGLLTLAGIRTRQAICPLRKELWLAGCLGVEPREMGSLWLRASASLWGIVLAEGLHDWGMRAVPLFSYTLAFALQLRKSTSLSEKEDVGYRNTPFQESFWYFSSREFFLIQIHECVPDAVDLISWSAACT